MDIVMPQLGETVLEGTVSAWYKKVGEVVRADESLFEIETEKTSMEVPAPHAGVLREILVPPGATVRVGARLAVLDTGAPPPPPGHVAAPAPRWLAPGILPRADGKRLSPAVRRLLGEAGISADAVAGTGRDGRVTREDVLAHLAKGAPAANDAAPPAASEDRVVPLNRIRRATAAHMARSVAASPHALQAVEADFHAVEKARRAHGAAWQAREGYALGPLPFVCRAVCAALAEFPLVNASFEDSALVVHGRVHLGIAVDLSFEGLVVPVVRNAAALGLAGLAREIHALVAAARAGTLAPDALAGGTYTVSNAGSFGTLITAPIIHQPQVAILSFDGVRKRAVVLEGPEGDAIAVRPVAVLAQSFDHRAFDGAYSAAFLRAVRRYIEEHDWTGEIGRGGTTR